MRSRPPAAFAGVQPGYQLLPLRFRRLPWNEHQVFVSSLAGDWLSQPSCDFAVEQKAGASDGDLSAFVQAHFKLALLTRAETDRLNKINRSRIAHDRLQSAGITVEPINHALPNACGVTPAVPPNNSVRDFPSTPSA